LEVRATCVWVLAPDIRKADDPLRDREPCRVWVVEAKEIDAPTGAEPVHWVLLTTLSVEGFDPARQVVRYYTRRWVIEDLSLVLKSGLRAERLQMDDAHTLMNTLALLYVVAWRVLHLRDMARFLPEEPAAAVVTPTEHAVLQAAEGRSLETVREVARAIAYLAGFPRYPSAGEPGVRTLWEGLQRLEASAFGWRLAHGQ
jgi:hypothetical protein